MEELQAPNTTNNNARNPSQGPINTNHATTHHIHGHEYQPDSHVEQSFFEDIDSTCSTPYVSAPSSPGRGSGPVNGGFYYSAPASPMHFALTASYPIMSPDNTSSSVALGFEFGSGSATDGSMSSADELFLNGKIRPMKLSTHLERPQVLAPLLDLDHEEEEEEESEGKMMEHELSRGRDLRVVRDKSMRRRTRSLSPLRSSSLKWNEESGLIDDDDDDVKQLKSGSCLDKVGNLDKSDDNSKSSESTAAAASLSASSSRSSSAGRSSKRWVFLKDFLYRSKSEGRSNNKFWSSITFSPVQKEKIKSSNSIQVSAASKDKEANNIVSSTGGSAENNQTKSKGQVKKPVNGIGKRRMPPSPHELHYTANRAQAEEMRKKTFLPYRQGLLGCLGFSSKGYGAMNGIARALNPVSSR